MNKIYKLLGRACCILFCVVMQISCGGGSESSNNNQTNSLPVANAGVDQRKPLNSTITLDGTRSSDLDGDLLTYAWSFTSVPLGSNASLSNDSSASPHFLADLLGSYVVGLVVSDSEGISASSEVTIFVSSEIIYENDFSQNTLSQFIVGEEGTAQVSIDQGQLRIDPGEGFMNRGYIALNLSSISNLYPPRLIDNPTKLTWAFNVSNVDGMICAACNNLFFLALRSTPDPSDPVGFGYSLTGGGFVGSRVMLRQGAHALSIFGPVSNTIVDLVDGLETLPTTGAFKVVYDPVTSLWELYYDENANTVNPNSITTLVGVGINAGFVSEQLPYLILGSQNNGHVFFDDFSVTLEYSP